MKKTYNQNRIYVYITKNQNYIIRSGYEKSYNKTKAGGILYIMMTDVRKKRKVEFKESDVKLALMILDKIRDAYNFFINLKEIKHSSFTIVLIKSETLRETILNEKRENDVFIDLDIPDLNLIFLLPSSDVDEADGFIRRMMSGIEEKSGDFASVVEVKNDTCLENTVFTLLVDYMMILKQPTEWRTGQISYKEV
jgi:hypothetical protein